MDPTSLPPLPVPDDESRPFWEGCKRRELLVQRCAACGRLRFPPRGLCPGCQSDRCDWVRASGRGTIYSRTVVHPPVLPAFRERVPFAVVLVELAEDPRLRLLGNVAGAAPDEVRIGRAVEVDFEDVSDELALPRWRLVAGSGTDERGGR